MGLRHPSHGRSSFGRRQGYTRGMDMIKFLKRAGKMLRLPLLLAAAAVLLVPAAQMSVAKATNATTIVISPSIRNIAVGSVGAVDVVVNDYNDPFPPGVNGQGLEGADISLSFNKNYVTVQDDNPFASGIQVTPGPLLASGSFLNLTNSADNSAGTINFVITQLNPTPPQNCPTPPTPCSGVLFTIHFNGNTIGMSPVTITSQALANPNGFQIPATTTNGVVNVQSPTASTVTKFSGTSAGTHGARLEWKTGTELSLLGFNVWRNEGTGEYGKVNAALIAAKSPGELTSNTYDFSDGNLSGGKTYHYKLETLMAGGVSEWSDPIAIAVADACAGKPGDAVLLSPVNNATVNSVVSLDWSDVVCATGYRVQIRRDSPGAGRSQTSVLVLRSDMRTILEPNHVYYWRVRAVTDKRHSGWSDWSAFRILERSERD